MVVILSHIFLNENLCNLIQISSKFVPGDPIDPSHKSHNALDKSKG